MAPGSPSRPSRVRAKHTVDRETRKERGTPERTPRERGVSRDGARRHERRRGQEEDRSKRSRRSVSAKHESYDSSHSGSHLLSSTALAQLDSLNEKSDHKVHKTPKKKHRVEKDPVRYHKAPRDRHDSRRRISGPMAEEGKVSRRSRRRAGYVAADERQGKKRFGRRVWILLAVLALIIIIAVAVGVSVSKRRTSSGNPSNDNLKSIKQDDVPPEARNTYLDPFTWYDTRDFNVTYTAETVGGLSVMGLNSAWKDDAQANPKVPPLNQPWAYGRMPIRGVNIGGWLSLEPFITPSLFNSYRADQGIVDEYSLTKLLGPTTAASTLDKHYSRFITEKDFADIQAAGFDHVRIPYSYWAVTTYPGDPYVPKIAWRYLLRGIEYARKHGLRVNLDLHGVPGSQNGWNHSGRQGAIGWLNGTDGQMNAQRSLDIHTQLATFFAQDRYKNIVSIYGLVNEPKMTKLPVADVQAWTTSAVSIVRKAGIRAKIAIGDGFLGLPNWQGQLQGLTDVVLDAHEYVIFDPEQIAFSHQKKIQFACDGWKQQMGISQNTATGFGPTLCGEWSQADTDCAQYLNNVGAGTRWEGTLQSTEKGGSVLTPSCPTKDGSCSCAQANAAPSSYSSQYKQWLMMNAQAQMNSFETAWGWFYWTWTTESATQWDYKAGMANGILPKQTWQRDFDCAGPVPDYHDLGEAY